MEFTQFCETRKFICEMRSDVRIRITRQYHFSVVTLSHCYPLPNNNPDSFAESTGPLSRIVPQFRCNTKWFKYDRD